MTITLTKAQAEQLLDAIRELEYSSSTAVADGKVREAKRTLTAALSAPQQEPVAWMRQEWGGSGRKFLEFDGPPPTPSVRDELVNSVWTPLYAQPAPAPQAEPDDEAHTFPLPQHLNITTHKDGTILAVTVNNSDGQIVQVLAEAPAPAPITGLSAEDQEAWNVRVRHAAKGRSNVERAILAVDALLRQRREPL